jgi:hypothetical protein
VRASGPQATLALKDDGSVNVGETIHRRVPNIARAAPRPESARSAMG